MITYGDVRQLAGLLEGEGTFGFYEGAIRLSLGMTDADVVQWAQRITGYTRPLKLKTRKSPRHKPVIYFALYGDLAASWMMMLYPFLGLRRKEQVRSVLTKWRATPLHASKRTRCPKGHEYDRFYTKAQHGRNQRICSACVRDWHRANRVKTSPGQLRLVV